MKRYVSLSQVCQTSVVASGRIAIFSFLLFVTGGGCDQHVTHPGCGPRVWHPWSKCYCYLSATYIADSQTNPWKFYFLYCHFWLSECQTILVRLDLPLKGGCLWFVVGFSALWNQVSFYLYLLSFTYFPLLNIVFVLYWLFWIKVNFCRQTFQTRSHDWNLYISMLSVYTGIAYLFCFQIDESFTALHITVWFLRAHL